MFQGHVNTFEGTDIKTGLKMLFAVYEHDLAYQLYLTQIAGRIDKSQRQEIDAFNLMILERLDLKVERKEGESPYYYWIRAMKVLNRLSFEDGEYNIPDSLAAAIVRNEKCKEFLVILGTD